MSDDTGRITVSRDALRADLAEMELRLVDKLATRAEVLALNTRLTGLEIWVNRMKGALALLSLVCLAFGAVLIKLVS